MEGHRVLGRGVYQADITKTQREREPRSHAPMSSSLYKRQLYEKAPGQKSDRGHARHYSQWAGDKLPREDERQRPFDAGKRNQSFHAPARNHIALPADDSHSDGIFLDLVLAPNFDLVEVLSGLVDLIGDDIGNVVE